MTTPLTMLSPKMHTLFIFESKPEHSLPKNKDDAGTRAAVLGSVHADRYNRGTSGVDVCRISMVTYSRYP